MCTQISVCLRPFKRAQNQRLSSSFLAYTNQRLSSFFQCTQMSVCPRLFSVHKSASVLAALSAILLVSLSEGRKTRSQDFQQHVGASNFSP